MILIRLTSRQGVARLALEFRRILNHRVSDYYQCRYQDASSDSEGNMDAMNPRRPHHAQCRSEEHTSELQSLMRISYAVFCLKTKKQITSTAAHDTLPIIHINVTENS